MADCGRTTPADSDVAGRGAASPLTVKKRPQQSPGPRHKYQSSAPGHCMKKVTLTKPTFCHSCSDFIWGLVGFLCEGESAQNHMDWKHWCSQWVTQVCLLLSRDAFRAHGQGEAEEVSC